MSSLMRGQEKNGHGAEHCKTVASHAAAAIRSHPEEIPPFQALAILCAALLHEVDDEKIFQTYDNFNARWILAQSFPAPIPALGAPQEELVEETVSLIKVVSCSKNGVSPLAFPWQAIPRDSDRLEAIGLPGIVRCLLYGRDRGRPFRLADTPRPLCEEDVWEAAQPERFRDYASGRPSLSTLDHFYDKILHLLRPGAEGSPFFSGNPYILEQVALRRAPVVDFLLRCEREKVENYDSPYILELLSNGEVSL